MFENQQIDQLPNVDELLFKNIRKAYLKVVLIHYLLFSGVLLTGFFLLVQYKLQEIFPTYIDGIYIGLLLLFLLILTFLIVGFYRRKFAIRERDISYKSGILIKKITTVPFSRIQHIEVDESPVSRIFSLASISVYTAGDSSDDLEIKGILKTEALQIKEFINQKING